MRHKKANWLLLLFSISIIACNRTTQPKESQHVQSKVLPPAIVVPPKDPLRLQEVISYAQSQWPGFDHPYSDRKIFNEFDFYDLLPLQQADSSIDKFSVFYSDKMRIVKILRESTLKDSDFEFKFIDDSSVDYSIFFAERYYEDELNNEQNDAVRGFILNYDDHCYFVSFDNSPLCIMELDSHLKVLKTLRFCSNQLIYRTKVNYVNNVDLYSDSLYVPKGKFSINTETLFSDVVKQFDSEITFYFEREMKFGLIKDDMHLPLWILGGHHEYESQISPKEGKLPRPKLSYDCLAVP